MLVLSRKSDQSIIVGSNVKIQVLKISGNTVRIGIEAPNDVKILRGELAPYDVDLTTVGTSTPAFEPITIDLELDQDDLTNLPNPFVVAQAS
jgi:carbon storage regulator CsrA